MTQDIVGVVAAGNLSAGIVHDGRLVSPVRLFPPPEDESDLPLEQQHQSVLASMPVEAIADMVAEMVAGLSIDTGRDPVALGLGFPGVIRDGVVEDSPNLKQVKGSRIADAVALALSGVGLRIPVHVFNDAAAVAAGLATTRGRTERLTRVWTLGNGVGFGRYPMVDGIWEGGHTVVSLDPKETFCGCGGKGHLEGIVGNRAMRLRFLDLEPEEIFERADYGEARCVDFEKLWHRAIAAASATSIHIDGPGRFFLSGPNARYVKIGLLNQYLHEMVTMSPLQGSVFEVVTSGIEIAIVGSAVNAARALADSVR